MILNDLLFTLAQTSDIDQPTLFPFPFGMHLGFAIISLLFFVYRFKDDRRPYQLIFAIAIPLSLAIWLSDKRTLFYIIGLLELLLIIAALVTAIVFRTPAADEADDDDDDESEDDNEEEAPADEKPADEKPAEEAPAEEAAEEVKNEVEE